MKWLWPSIWNQNHHILPVWLLGAEQNSVHRFMWQSEENQSKNDVSAASCLMKELSKHPSHRDGTAFCPASLHTSLSILSYPDALKQGIEWFLFKYFFLSELLCFYSMVCFIIKIKYFVGLFWFFFLSQNKMEPKFKFRNAVKEGFLFPV